MSSPAPYFSSAISRITKHNTSIITKASDFHMYTVYSNNKMNNDKA